MRTACDIIRTLIRAPWRPLVVDDQRTWKAGALYAGALHVARAVDRGSSAENVGIMLPTSGLFPMSLLGTWIAGRTATPLNYLLKEDELAYVVQDAGLDAIITVGPLLEHAPPLPSGVKLIRLDEMSFGGLPPLRRCVRRSDEDTAVILYTSGTSGRPKGVMLTAGNLSANINQCVEWAGFDARETFLGVLPQFHSFGLTVLTLLPLTIGCRVVYSARFVPRRIVELIRTHRPSAFIAIPSMLNALLTVKKATAEDMASLKYVVSGGEPLPDAVFQAFQDRFGITLNEGYGLTETSPVTNWCRPDEHVRGSVGPAVPRVRQKVVGPEGEALGRNAEGEICIAGPNIMKGYYKLPDETAAVMDGEGYFRTGDMGRIDDAGHLFITGRIKEMLIIAGENVFPREIEEVLNAHPSVSASAVIGMQDESRGELPLAFVELVEGADFDEGALRSWCRERLAQFKVPRELRRIDALPRNPTGKIMRRELSAAMPDEG